MNCMENITLLNDLPTLISVFIACRNTKSFNRSDNKRIVIILTEENLSKAIGRRGQNVRLASVNQF